MQIRSGRTVAVGILCAIAATVGLWSGALASASGALHSGAQVQVQSTSSHHAP
jgi:hypothetical protein